MRNINTMTELKHVLTAAMVAVTSAATAIAETPTHTLRQILSVDTLRVETPEETVPRLPYRLWVSYSDGTGAFRQVRWLNAGASVERQQAAMPLNSEYEVKGFVIGDNTTDNGYPVVAVVRVGGQWQTPDRHPVAAPLPLPWVRLIGENRLTQNRDRDIDHLLSLDVSQQLYNYRDTYGLPTDGYTVSDGWDSPTTKLKGHGTGHYLSALAFAYTCCTDELKKRQLSDNIKRMVREMRECQERTFVFDKQLGRYREARDLAPDEEMQGMKGTWDAFDTYKKDYAHYGYGYLNAIPPQHCVLIEKYSPYNNESGVWAPYYTIHKQLAGLIDIANCFDDRETCTKALQIARDMGLWVWNRLHYRTYVKTDGTREERRARPGNRYEMWNMYIAGEVGGMAESLARLSEMVSSAEDRTRLLEAANYFDSPAFFEPLSRNEDAIRNRHANQHIPMIIGALRSYQSNGNPYYYHLAENFWSFVQGRYRYAMGGVGNGEMFRQPYTQMLSLCGNASSWEGKTKPEPTINETCCAYNLAKLTKDLNGYDPDNAAYMDYYERVLYNQIVGSLNDADYGVTYQYAVGLNASKPFGNETPQASCCGGTGAENHVKYQEAAYFANNKTLWVALYLPTEVEWKSKGVTLRQECEWPADRSTIRVIKGSGRFSLKLRVPYWATEGFAVSLNGRVIQENCQPGTYVEIPQRMWTSKDRVSIVMPFTKHLDFAPDKMQLAVVEGEPSPRQYQPMWAGALMAGPMVMATTGISSWDEATLTLSEQLAEVPLRLTPSDAAAPLSLTVAQHTFIPDYMANEHATRYFRLQLPVPAIDRLPASIREMIARNRLDKSALEELLLDARSRIETQQAWEEMAVKVPEYAPWAKHGLARLRACYSESKALLDSEDIHLSQDSVNSKAAVLNAALNTMRPGNLPELEDLTELLSLLSKVKNSPSAATASCQEAIAYAEMVVKYVSDGSGTQDMIDKATERLKAYDDRNSLQK